MAGKIWHRFKEEDGNKAETESEDGDNSETGRRAKLKKPFRKLVSKVKAHVQQSQPDKVPAKVAPIWPIGSEIEVFVTADDAWVPAKVAKCDVENGQVVVEFKDKDGTWFRQTFPSDAPHLRQRRLHPAHKVAPGLDDGLKEGHVHFADRPPSIYEVTPYAKQYSVRPAFFDFDSDGNKIINEQAVEVGRQKGKPITKEELQKLRKPPSADWNSDTQLSVDQLTARNISAIPSPTQSYSLASSKQQPAPPAKAVRSSAPSPSTASTKAVPPPNPGTARAHPPPPATAPSPAPAPAKRPAGQQQQQPQMQQPHNLGQPQPTPIRMQPNPPSGSGSPGSTSPG
eukprot:CAMPEP_0178439092 /NCGR_PEP_ID=MMETSP0689_2-20121128/35966_1 /TAXON_ID=160604 /ORGANISM="Amphidinium massartii, Strain CS-259" /LENGTH=340 /DNA_ID=CAMNT_0020061587 /DNA_START=28 /DNA_END=1046 /DNA_ORIENTATION=-